MFYFVFNLRPHYSFQISLIANRPNCHVTNFCLVLFSAKWVPKCSNKLQEFLQNFYILFSYFRDLKVKHDFETEKEKIIKQKEKRPARPDAYAHARERGPSKPSAATRCLFFLFFF
jgi:hypothetical protein